MSYISAETARADQAKIEPYNEGAKNTSPAYAGTDKPGPENKLAGETMTMKRTTPKLGHTGDGVLRSKGE